MEAPHCFDLLIASTMLHNSPPVCNNSTCNN